MGVGLVSLSNWFWIQIQMYVLKMYVLKVNVWKGLPTYKAFLLVKNL